jgi:hypothetical protein
MAHKVWYKAFMKRDHSSGVPKSEGTSTVRAEKREINVYFDMPSQLMKPGSICNMDR